MGTTYSTNVLLRGDKVELKESLKEAGMLRATSRLLVLIALGSSLILAMLPLAGKFREVSAELPVMERLRAGGFWSVGFLVQALLLLFAAVVATLAFRYVLRKLEPESIPFVVEIR